MAKNSHLNSLTLDHRFKVKKFKIIFKTNLNLIDIPLTFAISIENK